MARTSNQPDPTPSPYTINVQLVLDAQTANSAVFKSLFSNLVKNVEGRLPSQTHQTTAHPEINIGSNSNRANYPNPSYPYSPPPSAPSTPARQPRYQQTPVDSQVHKESSALRATPSQTPQRPASHNLGILTPEPSPSAPTGICQAVKRSGLPCTARAKPEYGYLFCGWHRNEFISGNSRQSSTLPSSRSTQPRLSTIKSEPMPDKSTFEPETPTKPQRSSDRHSVLSSLQQASPSRQPTRVLDRQAFHPSLSGYAAEANISPSQPRTSRSMTRPSTGASRPQNWLTAEHMIRGLTNKFIPEHLTSETQHAICDSLMKDLPRSERDGWIYCFENPNLSDNACMCLKVGRSINPRERIQEWKRKRCGPNAPITKFMEHVPYYFRIEHLVHLHLIDLSRNSQHLDPGFADEWKTGPSTVPSSVPSSVPFSRNNPFKFPGVSCRNCKCMHKELFHLERFSLAEDDEEEQYPDYDNGYEYGSEDDYDPNSEDGGSEDDDAFEKSEEQTVQVVQRVVQYWADVARCHWA